MSDAPHREEASAAPSSSGGAPTLETLARRYWRLWRRNWRPPFPPNDAPGDPAGDER